MATPVTLVPDTPGGTLPTQPVNIASGGVASGAVASGAYASGSLAAGAMVDLVAVTGSKAAGTAAASSALTGAVYNTTAPAPTNGQQTASQADAAGSHQVNTEGKRATYSASAQLAPAASATDVLTITGSASKTVRVTRIQFNVQATSAISLPIALAKRSTANSGGTSAAVTAVPHDSANAAATATVLNYSANPTVGNLVDNPRRQLITVPAGTPTYGSTPIIWDFTTRNGQGIVLRGTSQVLAINFLSQTLTGGSGSADIEWTEE